MARLTKIYTRTGDDGTTAIADGSRVSKLDARIVAGGSVDETNSAIGVAVTHLPPGDLRQTLQMIQQQKMLMPVSACRSHTISSPNNMMAIWQ